MRRRLALAVVLLLAGCAAPADRPADSGTSDLHTSSATPMTASASPSSSGPLAPSSDLPQDFLVLVAFGNLSQVPPHSGSVGACGRPANRFAGLDVPDSRLTVVRDGTAYGHDLGPSTWLVVYDGVAYTDDESSCDWPLLWGKEGDAFSQEWGDLAVSASRGDATVTARGQPLEPGAHAFWARTPEANGRHFEGNVTLQALRWTAANVSEIGSEYDVPESAAWAFWDPSRD